jgi:predicted transcriptional regulator
MHNLFVAYLLWFLSGFGVLGFHRFYLGKIPSGLLWMFTGGLGMFGAIYDFFTLPNQVREANIRNALYNREMQDYRKVGQTVRYADDAQARIIYGKPDNPSTAHNNKVSIEHVILKIAKENKGILTVSEVALGAGIPIDEAKKCLELLTSKGLAELRVRRSGSLVYVIPDMLDKDEPLEDM